MKASALEGLEIHTVAGSQSQNSVSLGTGRCLQIVRVQRKGKEHELYWRRASEKKSPITWLWEEESGLSEACGPAASRETIS